ncbi:MAG: hypothetical protein ACLQUT_02300 [Thermoleophilia bacterium]
MSLDSFIVSRTPLNQLSWRDGGMSEVDFARRHVVRQTPGDTGYVEQIAQNVLGLRRSQTA